MERTLVKDIRSQIGKDVTVKGFVQVIRDQKAVQFLILRDHSGMVQVVVERSEANAQFNQILASLARESAVEVSGRVVDNPRVKLGQVEILLSDLIVDSNSEPVLPVDISGQTLTEIDKRLDWRFLDLRRPENQLIFRIQTTVEQAMREFWVAEGFVEIHTPKLMGSASEGGAELFTLPYFGQTAALAQSPQFFKQMAMAAGLDRVFEIGPVFRADPSFTSRHATEFTSVDMEMSWIDSHVDVMELEERWLRHILEQVKDKHGAEIKTFYDTEVVIPEVPFPKFSMAEAQQILRREGHTPPSDTRTGDIDPQGERVLCEYVRRELGHEFVFITDYPKDIRPFYHMRYADRPGITKSFDLLWKWMEITTGSQREHRYDVLESQAREMGVTLDAIQFYLDFFRFGCPPHGGFGFGLARLLAALVNQGNIREVTFLHRGPNRLVP
jgi:nondiscriminating aspartyl-tRNA synthetase